jgi:hypothetical protein
LLRAGTLIKARGSDHIQQIGILHPCVCRDFPANTIRPRKLSKIELGPTPRGGCEALARETERSKIMSLIQLVEVLVVVGVLLWLVNRFIPMQGTIKSILNGVVVIALVLWMLSAFGLFHSLSRIRIGS